MNIENLNFKECPFCGNKPRISKSYIPAELTISCVNEECLINPSYSVRVECINNGDDTFTPLFEKSYKKLSDVWNKRN